MPLTKYILDACSGHDELTIADNWALNLQRETYRREYHARMKAAGVDVILCPAYFAVGELQGEARYWNYTAIWNVLDQPAVTFPSGSFADKDVDVEPQVDAATRTKADAHPYLKCESLDPCSLVTSPLPLRR